MQNNLDDVAGVEKSETCKNAVFVYMSIQLEGETKITNRKNQV